MQTTRRAALAGALAGLWAMTASAADVDVRSTTLIGGRPDVVDGQVKTVVPITELVGVSARRIENPVVDDLEVAIDAWANYEVNAERNPLGSDVNVANVAGKLLHEKLSLRLGRQTLVGGAARLLFFDGLHVDYRLPANLGVTVYAGMPVAKRFGNVRDGELLAGGRLWWSPSYTTEVGASFIYATGRTDLGNGVAKALLAREDVALDARARLGRTVNLKGAAFYSLADQRLAEVDVGPHWQPSQALEVMADYRRVAPDLLLPRNSIMSVFADTTRDDVGLSATYSPMSAVALFGEARMLWLEGKPGYDAGLRGTWRVERLANTMVTVQGRRLQIPDNGYWQGRVAGRKTLGELTLALDLEATMLDVAVRGQTQSYSAMANASWRFAPAWQAGVSAFAATTPTFEARYEVLAKLIYTFSHEAPKAAPRAAE